ncbi:MAG: tetratricopeptide repeat protein [Roseomonas sp.]|nr:tetratricopeptide repeat protein [Roseomonas sp.]MCA3312088.1 tetratricopeptide repeat protein [Roseomonas sp.]MCA3316403.1 tetratricopeptide repeat protein [Roseomonas sp.]MCA3319775.1 tetratricopeptide repeat protein [Roseomonas sp.]MCA3341490.1 tetratricopeptide repeat protein [Roseomonas sp.]
MSEEHKTPPAEEATGKKGLISGLVKLWAKVQAVLFTVMPMIIGVVLIVLIVREINQDSIEVAPIQVPARLAETGLTAEVVALRLLDQIAAAERIVTSERVVRPHVELIGQKPDFTVPIAGISLRALADIARNLIGVAPRRVSGEIILDDNKLKLRLRLAGQGQIADIGGFALNEVDALLAAGAPEVWRVIFPKLYAWHLAQTLGVETEVRERLTRMLLLDGLDADAQRTVRALIGRSFLRSGRGQDAYVIFSALVANNPNDGGFVYGRGRAQFLLGRLDAAMEDYAHARQLDPAAFWIHTGIAQVIRERGDYAKALEEIEKGLASRPDDPTGLTEKGEIMLRLGRSQEALKLVQDALVYDPYSPAAHLLLGRLRLAQYDGRGALEAMTEATRRAPTSMDAHMGLAEALLSIGRTAEAEASLNKVLSFGPLPTRLEGKIVRMRSAFKEIGDPAN